MAAIFDFNGSDFFLLTMIESVTYRNIFWSKPKSIELKILSGVYHCDLKPIDSRVSAT